MSGIINKINSIEPEADAKKLNITPVLVSESQAVSDEKETAPEYMGSDTPQSQPLIPPTEPEQPHRFGLITALLCLIWLIGSVVTAYSLFGLNTGTTHITPTMWGSLAFLSLFPLCIIALTGYSFRQLARVGQKAEKLQTTAEALITPDTGVIGRSAVMADNIKREIAGINTDVDAALNRMDILQTTLSEQSDSIQRSNYLTEKNTDAIAKRLREEREALVEIAEIFDARMASLSETMDMHTQKLADSTHTAEQKIQEARLSVESAAEKINASSEIVRNNTVDAAGSLSSNHAEITRLGEELQTRAEELDSVYRKHAGDLADMIAGIKAEQEKLGASLEERLKKMRDMSLSAQLSAQTLSEASRSGQETVEALADAARLTDSAVKQRFADLENMVRYSTSETENISEKATRRVHESLALTRKEIARIENDMLALQNKISARPVISPQSQSRQTPEKPADEPTIVAAPSRGLSGLRPLEDVELPEVQPRKSSIRITPAHTDPETLPDITLRPAPEQTEAFDKPIEIMDNNIDDDFELAIPEPEEIREFTAEPESTTSSASEELILKVSTPPELSFEIPASDDLDAPDPDADIVNFDPDILRRPVENFATPVKKQGTSDKTPWWKSILPGGRKDDGPSAKDIVGPPLTQPAADAAQHTKDDDGLTPSEEPGQSLAGLGLNPLSLIDADCVSEAVSVRFEQGPLAMSDAVTERLRKPVAILVAAIQNDPALKTKLTAFARDFHMSLSAIEDKKDALAARFSTEAGKTFLLCDAALNR